MLTRDKVRALLDRGESVRDIAEEYGCSPSTIYRIISTIPTPRTDEQIVATFAPHQRRRVAELLRHIAERGSSEDFDARVIHRHVSGWRDDGATWWTCAQRLIDWGFRDFFGRRWSAISLRTWWVEQERKRASA